MISKWFFEKVIIALVLGVASISAQGEAGDNWMLVRGDASPGVTYSALVETSSGRLLAAGDGGQLMISDDGGSTWRYDVIQVNGQPLFGRVSDLIRNGSQIIGTVLSVEPSSNEFGLPYQGRTQIITSADNGNSWQLTNFPHTSASFFGRQIPGVFLERLHVSAGGQLLAYGTALLAAPPVYWSIGGAVFRHTGGNNWEQAFYQMGALESMSDANGRLVATGFQTVIDSADGAGWNGYTFDNAQFIVNGQPLGDDVRRRLAATDITWDNGNYVMQTQAHKPLANHPHILTSHVDHTYTFRSANPFDGGRNWQGVEHDRLYPFFLQMDNGILSMLGSVYRTGDAGQNWNMVHAQAGTYTRSYGRVGANRAVAVRSSESVWRSVDGGTNWDQVLEQPYIPDLNVDLSVGGILYAREPYDSNGSDVYRSLDNGLTWTQIADVRAQTGIRGLRTLHEHNGLIFAQQTSASLAVSADGGFTWSTRPLPATSSETIVNIVAQSTGRLIGLPRSKSIWNLAAFHHSDDGGQTWQVGAEIPLEYNSQVKSGLALAGGRLIGLYNQFASFGPELFISDDNGVNWRREDPFTGLDGLRNNGEAERFIELKQVFQSRTGRVLILGGDGEILTSDDRGGSWVVRRNLELEELADGHGFDGRVDDLVQAGDRLIVSGIRNDPTRNFVLISEDDGTTWREVGIKTQMANTGLYMAFAGPDGRLILSGSNGAVYISDAIVEPTPQPAQKPVRESETITISVPRPPMDGFISASYNATGIEAEEGLDFVPLAGTLEWAEDDDEPKSIVVQTLDDSIAEGDESLVVEVHFTADASGSGATTGAAPQADTPQLTLDTSYLIVIHDNASTGQAGIDLLADGPLRTTEAGGTAVFRLVLTRPPTADVVLGLVVGDPSQVSLNVYNLTFNPSNWKKPQSITATGVDNTARDGDVAVQIKVFSSSDDTAYDGLAPLSVYVTNIDDDDPVLFADGFEAAR